MAVIASASPAIADDSVLATGKRVFKKCAACHSLEPGKIKIGPPLFGVVGRKAGSVPRFRYSKAMKNSGIVWSAETLDQYLKDPKKFVPGNRMPFPGLKKEEERTGVIRYLSRTTRD